MPQRPRKLSTKAQQTKPHISRAHEQNARTSAKLKSKPTSQSPEEELEIDEDEYTDDVMSENVAYSAGETESDLDAPRVSQWVDEDELDRFDEDDASEEEGGPEPEFVSTPKQPSQKKLVSLQDDLSSLPLGALRKAQLALATAKAGESDSDEAENSESEETDDESAPEEGAATSAAANEEKAKPEWSTKPRTDIAKRSNKHAPTEVTSKRPVTRRRTVVEVKKMEPRDPRFLPVAGEFSVQKFQGQYGFLADLHVKELSTLRENLKRARKLLASSPRDLREEREAEVTRLEQAVKRTESLVNRDRREKVEQAALRKVAQQEKDKRKQGKGNWYMKKGEKKELLLKARYEELASTGGKLAIKKAIEKKQKKIAQKEKKSRPFARGEGSNTHNSGSSDRPTKRRRTG